VEKIDQHIFELAQGSVGYQGIGGMKTKMEAAKLATDSGIAVAIANGHESEAITRLALGESIGTFFPPVTTKLESRKRWMLSGLASKGKLAVDTGAAKAIKEQNKSLLPAGIKELIGDFESGDVVEIIDLQGNRLAQGITNYSSTDVAIIKGCRSAQIASLLGYEYGAEVVHRNNMVVL
jgi:glutamate 5-kinase